MDLTQCSQEIVPGLWLGPVACANDAAYLGAMGITHRVTCLHDALAPVDGVVTLHVDICDNNLENIAPFFETTTPFIAAALGVPGAKCLVHCSSGVSRSTTIVLAFLIAPRQLSLRAAMRLVSEKRSCVLPATKFFAALQSLDLNVHNVASTTLVDYNTQQLRAITGHPLETCAKELAAHGGSVEHAVTALFVLHRQQSNDAAEQVSEADTSDAALLFTYGTLMRGFHNHLLMEEAGAEFVGLFQTVQKYALFVANVPFVHPDICRDVIYGEVYRVPWRRMAALDVLEDHPQFYVRRLVDVAPQSAAATATAHTEQAWLYFNSFVSDLADSLVPAVYIPTGNFHDTAQFGNPGSMGDHPSK